jgi:hypothetical protein
MAESVRERVARHRLLYALGDGLVRVEAELPRVLVEALRLPDESIRGMLQRALLALRREMAAHPERLPDFPLPETRRRSARPRVLPETSLLPETARPPQRPTPAAALPETSLLPETPAAQTPDDQAMLIALWNQGLEVKAIADALGIKWTAAQSRARRLQVKGLIQPRPRGGDYPSRRAQARQSPETP